MDVATKRAKGIATLQSILAVLSVVAIVATALWWGYPKYRDFNTRPYCIEDSVFPVDIFRVQTFTIVNPGPAWVDAANLTIIWRGNYDESVVWCEYFPGTVHVSDAEGERLAKPNTVFSLDLGKSDRARLGPGQSFSISVIWSTEALGGVHPIRESAASANGTLLPKRLREKATEHISWAFWIAFGAATVVLFALLCTVVSYLEARSSDRKTADRAKPTADGLKELRKFIRETLAEQHGRESTDSSDS